MNRVKSIAVWILHILLAAMFSVQGVAKLASSPSWVSRFKAWSYPDNFYIVIGAVELLCGVSLLVPKLAGFGAVVLAVVMVGATITHLIHSETQVVTTLMLMIMLGVSAYIRRSSFSQLRNFLMKSSG